MLLLVRYQRDEAGWNTWKNIASETTQGKLFLTEVSKSCVAPGWHPPGGAQTGWAIPIWDNRKKEIKTPNMIEDKQWRELGN